MSEKRYYVLTIGTEEAFDAIATEKGNRLLYVLKHTAGFVGIHMPEDGSVVLLLFENHDSRSRAMSQLIISGWHSVHAEEKFAYADIEALS